MNVYVSLEHRFYTYNNTLYTDGAFNRSFWKRYLDVFDKVTLIARCKKIDMPLENLEKVSGDRIAFYPVTHYIGFKEKLKTHSIVKKELKNIATDKESAYILRVGSPLADILAPELRKNGINYAVEVVGDPWDVFAPGAFDNKLRPFMRIYFAKKLKSQCFHAKFSSYVTENALQKRYPPVNSKFSINASSIELKEEFFAKKNKDEFKNKTWLFVGTLEQYQKAPDILIKAFNEIDDPSISLTIIGDGRMRPELEEMSTNSNVKFIGKLKSSNEVREYLISNPYFVLPSRGEGLPRAVIEAMACSCVCVGSDIGGIKELLEESYIVRANEVQDLKNKIIEVSNTNLEETHKNSKRNHNKALEYKHDILEKRRKSFYEKIKEEVLSR